MGKTKQWKFCVSDTLIADSKYDQASNIQLQSTVSKMLNTGTVHVLYNTTAV